MALILTNDIQNVILHNFKRPSDTLSNVNVSTVTYKHQQQLEKYLIKNNFISCSFGKLSTSTIRFWNQK